MHAFIGLINKSHSVYCLWRTRYDGLKNKPIRTNVITFKSAPILNFEFPRFTQGALWVASEGDFDFSCVLREKTSCSRDGILGFLDLMILFIFLSKTVFSNPSRTNANLLAPFTSACKNFNKLLSLWSKLMQSFSSEYPDSGLHCQNKMTLSGRLYSTCGYRKATVCSFATPINYNVLRFDSTSSYIVESWHFSLDWLAFVMTSSNSLCTYTSVWRTLSPNESSRAAMIWIILWHLRIAQHQCFCPTSWDYALYEVDACKLFEDSSLSIFWNWAHHPSQPWRSPLNFFSSTFGSQ